jgi:uncharacterized protein (TIGR03492 family)
LFEFQAMSPLLIISNGHGEDVVSSRVIDRLQALPHCPPISVLPLVGTGHIFQSKGIPILGRVEIMPSGGFINMDPRQLWRDISGGLLGLTLSQYQLVRDWGKRGGKILAVGDIVPLLFAFCSGVDYAFIGTAKSEYYLRDEEGWLSGTTWPDKLWQSYYYPWERYFMSHERCRAVFVRDTLTSKILQRWPIRVFDCGNPMMDDLDTEADQSSDNWVSILLLPGSRLPESVNNWLKILAALKGIVESFPDRAIHFLGAISPNTDLGNFESPLEDFGFSRCGDGFNSGRAILTLSQTSYPQYLARADLAIAMAGTATEQVVGSGKPVITMPGDGPQFTAHFARLQTRLLGCSVILVPSPAEVAPCVTNLLQNPELLQRIKENGKQRLGLPGASQRIAGYLLQKLGYSLEDPQQCYKDK